MTEFIFIGIILTEKEFIHLFTKQLNNYLIRSIDEELNSENSYLKKEEKNKLSVFVEKLKKNGLLDNLNVYLNIFELEYEIKDFIIEQFNFNISPEELGYYNNDFTITYLSESRNFIIAYDYCMEDLKKPIIISNLNSDKDPNNIIRFLSECSELIKLHTNNISQDIVNIINRYIIVDISKKKIEIVIDNI